MSSVLIVGGDQVDGIKEVFGNYGIDNIHHWSGRNGGDSNKVIPQNTKLIVLVTKWVNHSITHKVKNYASKRGIKILYIPSGSKERMFDIIKKDELKPTIESAFNQKKWWPLNA
ncbi:DUF2325 domain-containing protein [Methylotenera sp.]|uniref:DUF2325 domain-containing protein n=1 Tax=Methylotenera sp. TaxID=2051956 RepID=UPI0026007CC6|nr:DUF2325 domain-containing protein [uncultured Methylotenera sp.]